MDTKRLIEICDLISQNVENDANEFDGKPFTGKTVAEYFGNQGSAIKALSEIVKEILLTFKK